MRERRQRNYNNMLDLRLDDDQIVEMICDSLESKDFQTYKYTDRNKIIMESFASDVYQTVEVNLRSHLGIHEGPNQGAYPGKGVFEPIPFQTSIGNRVV